MAELEEAVARKFAVEDHLLAVVRIGESVYVIGDTCSHAEVSLSEGDVDTDTCHIACWRHGSSFSLETGEPNVLPATDPVRVYEASVVDGNVFVVLPGSELREDSSVAVGISVDRSGPVPSAE